MPRDLRVSFLADSPEYGAVYGSKAVGEPPLMLAFSVREALRDAVAAFGPGTTKPSVELDAPSTPEAVWWAITRAREA
jgi:xanthine dehydrogenase large subunit